MASEITNKFSGQVMRVYFTVFSLDSLSLSLRLNFQTIIRSKVQLVISLSIGSKISKKRRNPDIPVTKTRLHVSALSMQWNLNVAIVFDTTGRNVVIIIPRSTGFQPDRKLQFLVSRHLLPDNYSKTAVIEVYSGRQLLLRFPATYPSCPSKSFSLSLSLFLSLPPSLSQLP